MAPTWYQPVIPVTPGTSPWQVEHTPRPSSTNSTRLWTRAEVDGGTSNGPPKTPSGSKSVALLVQDDEKTTPKINTNTPNT